MKKVCVLSVLIIATLALVSPSFGHGWYYGGCGWGSCGYNGWEAAAIVGGSILLGTFLGIMINNSYWPVPPSQETYVYPETQYPYAAPDPAFVERHAGKENHGSQPGPEYSSQENIANQPGEWVTVPGQWVQDAWVPSHRVWVPDNP